MTVKKYLKYTHPAATTYDLSKSYELDELKKELDMEMIKILFTPVGDWNWEDLQPKRKIVKVEENLEIE